MVNYLNVGTRDGYGTETENERVQDSDRSGPVWRPGKALEATTTSISQKNDISQQSVSRALIKLEEESLINRTKAGRIKITAKGKDRLEDIYRDLIMALRAEENIALTGKVVSGMGEGQYYMGLEGYRKQFVAKSRV